MTSNQWGPNQHSVGKNPAAVALGKRKSKKKAAASRENGKLGGRPRKQAGAGRKEPSDVVLD